MPSSKKHQSPKISLTDIQTPGFLSKRFKDKIELEIGLHIISGGNGIGKTVFLNSLIGFYGHGPIIKSTHNEHVKISYYDQNSYIASASLVWNLLFDDSKNGDANKLTADIELLMCEFNIEMRLGGVDSKIYPNKLSGGQIKKIGLIRTLVRKADLYLLDEPCNDLDVKSVEVLKVRLCQLSKKSCVVVVTHNPSFEELPHSRLIILDA